MFYRSITSGLLIVCVLIMPHVTWGNTMQGGVYKISRDVVAPTGGIGSGNTYKAVDVIGEAVAGISESSEYRVKSGYQETLESYIAVSHVLPVIMDTPLGGLSGGESNGTTSVVVTTDNTAGYQLVIAATEEVALQSSNASIANYAPSLGETDYLFQTAVNDVHFGYTVFGPDVTAPFLSDGLHCGAGTTEPGRCWTGLSTDSRLVAESFESNHPLGTQTDVQYRVGIGVGLMQLPGTYVSTTTITALPR